jgi:L-amino acid N-acyltransferase YncA
MSWLVRPAKVMDAATIGRIHVECWRQAYGHFLSAEFLAALDPVTRGEGWARMLAEDRPGENVAVLEVDGEIRGFAASGPNVDEDATTELQVYSVYQLETEHGSGSGQALLDAVVGAKPASLWVAELNTRAQAFYLRNGFRFDGTSKQESRWENLVELRMTR